MGAGELLSGAPRALRRGLAKLKRRYPDGLYIFDFEYFAPPGCRPKPICLVVENLWTGQRREFWLWDRLPAKCPLPTGRKALWVGYGLAGDLACFIWLGWSFPDNLVDLHTEHFAHVNDGTKLTQGNRRLLQVLDCCGIESIGAEEKEAGRALAKRGGPFYSAQERTELVNYCSTDIDATGRLAIKLLSSNRCSIDHAVYRGHFIKCCAWMEWTGLPIDSERLDLFRKRRPEIVHHILEICDPDHEVFDIDGRFSYQRLAEWIVRHDLIDWPADASGKPVADEETFAAMAGRHEIVKPIRDARRALAKLVGRKEALQIGPDGRARWWPAPFTSKTSRSVPKANSNIFARAAWERSEFIKPPFGWACSYLDFRAQEIGIAAVLSSDKNLLTDYRPDPHMAAAIRAGLVPVGSTKRTHPNEREIAKALFFSILYGTGAHGLAVRLRKPDSIAGRLLREYRQELYPEFARWSDGVVDRARRENVIVNRFGWLMHLTPLTGDNTLRNYHIQSLGADMIRVAAFLAIRAGAQVAATVHDALFIVARDVDIERQSALARTAMIEASRWALDGFELDVEGWESEKMIRYPNRFNEPRDSDIRSRFIDPILDRPEHEEVLELGA